MCTAAECRILDITYRKYRKGRPVEEEDVWAIRRLSESDLVRMYFKGDRLYATATFRDIKGH